VDTSFGGTDPFGAFELPQDSTTDLALHHCKNQFHNNTEKPYRGIKTPMTNYLGANVFQNTRMPITPRQGWMKINLSDKTLLSVT
jgi:hypothetical protein